MTAHSTYTLRRSGQRRRPPCPPPPPTFPRLSAPPPHCPPRRLAPPLLRSFGLAWLRASPARRWLCASSRPWSRRYSPSRRLRACSCQRRRSRTRAPGAAVGAAPPPAARGGLPAMAADPGGGRPGPAGASSGRDTPRALFSRVRCRRETRPARGAGLWDGGGVDGPTSTRPLGPASVGTPAAAGGGTGAAPRAAAPGLHGNARSTGPGRGELPEARIVEAPRIRVVVIPQRRNGPQPPAACGYFLDALKC